ncbi:hypothetical protein [Variovorax sp. GB1P17]|uniref:hypothetical protein n=1 Tax=Variovorax sp. GB1P17 TaxID=3443740 RepID=UPI003F44E236
MYAAASAPWHLGMAAISVFIPLVGAGVLTYAFKARKRPRSEILAHLVVPALGGAFMMLVGIGSLASGVMLTKKCLAPGGAADVREFRGKIDRVEMLGKPGGIRLYVVIGGEGFHTAGLGSSSECGFKASLGQSVYPQTGGFVEGKAVGSTIVELREVK